MRTSKYGDNLKPRSEVQRWMDMFADIQAVMAYGNRYNEWKRLWEEGQISSDTPPPDPPRPVKEIREAF